MGLEASRPIGMQLMWGNEKSHPTNIIKNDATATMSTGPTWLASNCCKLVVLLFITVTGNYNSPLTLVSES